MYKLYIEIISRTIRINLDTQSHINLKAGLTHIVNMQLLLFYYTDSGYIWDLNSNEESIKKSGRKICSWEFLSAYRYLRMWWRQDFVFNIRQFSAILTICTTVCVYTAFSHSFSYFICSHWLLVLCSLIPCRYKTITNSK